MSAETTESRVREIVAEQLGLNAEEISLDAALTADLGADALDLVELVMALEEEFDLEIGDEEAEGLRTVQEIIDFMGQRVQ